MLTIIVDGDEYFNENTQTFEYPEATVVLEFEHSLVSLSKWESKHEKPFLSANNKTPEEVLDYLQCMLLTEDVDKETLYRCSDKNLSDIQNYIQSGQTATTFGEMPGRRGIGEVITSELIYYWMVSYNIPFECENWHLNRLFALIKICNIKSSKPKKMSRHEIANRNRELNAQRRAKYGTQG